MKNTNMNIRISPEIKRQITELAANEGRSVSNLIERWITERYASGHGRELTGIPAVDDCPSARKDAPK